MNRLSGPTLGPWVAATAGAMLVGVAGLSGTGAPARVVQQRPAHAGGVPVAARSLVARTLGRAERRFFAHRTQQGFRVRDGGVSATFTRRDVVVQAAGVSWGLGLRSVGRGDRLVAQRRVSPSSSANVVRYSGDGVEAWYAAGPLGLEQGFTLAARPPGQDRRLTLALGSAPRTLRSVVTPDRRTLLLERAGRVLLRYTGLSARDARGRALPASIEVRQQRLALRVDDRGARYPLRIDPFVQAGKLTASDGVSGDVLGSSVAVSGDTIVVGAPIPSSRPGAAYVFVKPAGGWGNATETAKLAASDGAAGDGFGSAVAISGDTIVVGAPDKNNNQGAAYVFVKPAGG
jgi:hypothetical protein